MLESVTASFTASSAAAADGIGCIDVRLQAKAHTSRSNIAAISTAARAERERHAVLSSML
jgi:hypothetical protein